MSMSRSVLPIIILILCCCAYGQSPPAATVVSVTPRGPTQTLDQSQMISVTFNQPMVPLQELPQDEGTGPMVITPTVKGKYRWQGTTTLSFIPEKNLPYSTLFTITIPAGTKSVLGQPLERDFIWQFETPRPRVISHIPGNTQRYVELDHAITILFNQPVNPTSVSQFISVTEQVGHEVRPLQYTIETGQNANEVILKLHGHLRKSAGVTVRTRAGLQGIEGSLPMQQDHVFRFSTYNDLFFRGVLNEKNFHPHESLRLSFSNPVSVKSVLDRIMTDPPAPRRDWYRDTHEYYSDEVHVPLTFEPEQEYRATITPGVYDRFGQSIRDTVRFTFRTGAFPPGVSMTRGQGVLESYESHKVPVTFMNWDSVWVSMGKIDPEKIVEVMQKLDYAYYVRLAWEEAILKWVDSETEDPSKFSVNRPWRPKIVRNKQTVHPVDLDEVLGDAKLGIVLLQIDDCMGKYLKSLIQVTNLGITGKFSANDNLIWVTRLKDAMPVERASVELRDNDNRLLWFGVTDSNGFVKTPGWGKLGLIPESYYWYSRHPRIWVIAKKGKDVAFSNSEWNDGIEPWTFNVNEDWDPQFEPVTARLFADRGLYRAGEKVDIKGIVRQRREDTWIISRKIDLRLTIRDSRNQEVYTTEPKLSPFGSFAVDLPLKTSAPLGYYSMQLERKQTGKNGDEWKHITTETFRVEAFRPAEFEVTVRMDDRRYVVGDTIKGFISGQYLFGAPMSKAPVRWRVSAAGSWFRPEEYEGFIFGPRWYSRYRGGYGIISSKDDTLDERGGLKVAVVTNAGDLRGPQSLTLEADVTSPSRQVISGRANIFVHGSEFYIGVSPSTTFLNKDSTLTYKIVAVTPNREIVPSVRVSVKFIKRIWRSVRRAETGGRYSWDSEVEDLVQDSLVVTTGREPVVRTFKPKDPGLYFMEAEGKDKRGNIVYSTAYFYTVGEGYVPWERRDDDIIELVADKEHYKPGDVARIMVKSPYERAVAMVTIERDGVLQHFSTTVVGSASVVQIPILHEHLPNVYVSVVLVQGRVAGIAPTREADVGRPSFKIGYVGLSISPLEKLLKVTVTPDRQSYRPGDSVEVHITTTLNDGAGVSAEVTMSVADLGVLNLIGYRMPNVFNTFYGPRPLGVVTSETRIHLIGQRDYGEKGEEEGGGGGEEYPDVLDAEGVRKDFRPSAYWNPSIITDKSGVARVRFKLPDNLTAFQIMAVAQTLNSDFGYGENSFQVNKPLLLQPALPRFARVGDTFEGGVVIVNYSDQDKRVRLSTRTNGIQFGGKDSLEVLLKPGQAHEVRHKLKAQKVGTATFVFKAWTETDYDGLMWKIPIQVPRLREAVATYASSVDPRALEKIIVPGEVYTDLSNLEITLASTAMVGLSGGISYLFDYPYGCLEQRVSRLLPIIIAKDLVEAFNFTVFEHKNYKVVAQAYVNEIPLFQRSNGGFAYWKNTGDTWAYVSAFAVYALVQAELNGYAVDKTVVEAGFKYLGEVLNGNHLHWYSVDVQRCIRALVLYTFALKGKPDFGHMDRLYGERNALPLFAKAYLLRALTLAKGNATMMEELAQDLTNNAKVAQTSAHFEERASSDWAWMYHSDTRTTALTLQALVEIQPNNPLIPKVVRWLVDRQKNGCWRTTQENLYVIDALVTYFRVFEKEEPKFRVEVFLAGKQLMKELFEGRSLRTAFHAASLSTLERSAEYPVEFLKDGPGRLYYTLRMNYYPRGETRAKEEGIAVMKQVDKFEQISSTLARIKVGTIAKVTLTISTNQSRNFVVVDDPIPAGLEIVNTSFQTTATQLGREETEESREWWWENPFRHREMYDDRALFFADYLPPGVHTVTYLVRATSYGDFAMPATRAEGMYEPEVFGQTASRVIKVE